MTNIISTQGMTLRSVRNLTTGQSTLSLLTEQLATGKKSLNLADYSSSEAQKLMNLSNSIAERQAFLNVITTIDSRLQVYDQSLTGIEEIAAEATTTILTASTYNPTQNDALSEQIQGFMQQVSYYLNQKVGDRYIYAGTRYGMVPVGDLTALAVPPVETAPYTVASPALPSYDTEYATNNPNAAAWVEDQVSIDSAQKVTYGVTSTAEGFQQLIMGLRWAYAATQDQVNYQTYMTTARDLISDGLTAIRGIHAGVSSASSALGQTTELHENLINTLVSQLDDIQSVDVNEVAVKLNAYKAELEASYAATAIMTNLSILKYL